MDSFSLLKKLPRMLRFRCLPGLAPLPVNARLQLAGRKGLEGAWRLASCSRPNGGRVEPQNPGNVLKKNQHEKTHVGGPPKIGVGPTHTLGICRTCTWVHFEPETHLSEEEFSSSDPSFHQTFEFSAPQR